MKTETELRKEVMDETLSLIEEMKELQRDYDNYRKECEQRNQN